MMPWESQRSCKILSIPSPRRDLVAGASPTMISAQQAIQRLQAGNARFMADRLELSKAAGTERRSTTVAGQQPWAVVLGCADSRVPVEVVFDQGIGELFVVRVAGNVSDPTVIGSIEYAATALRVPLVVVLGHAGCGAVQATLHAIQDPTESLPPNLGSVVERIRQSIELPLAGALGDEPAGLLAQAIRANVRGSVHHLASDSQVLGPLVQGGDLTVVGAEYSLETGQVDFFE